MKKALLQLILVSLLPLKALPANQGHENSFVFTDSSQSQYKNIETNIYWFHDRDVSLKYERLMTDFASQNEFKPFSALGVIPENSYQVLWGRIKFKNLSGSSIHYFLNFYSDTVDIYLAGSGENAPRYKSGYLRNISEKPYPSNKNYIPVELLSGDSLTYYLRVAIDGYYPVNNITSVSLIKDLELIEKQDFSLFTDGMQLAMIVIGIFLFFIFKDRGYLVFILPLLGFLLWFSSNNGELHRFLHSPPLVAKFFNSAFTAWFMPSAVAFFLVSYVEMRKHFKIAWYVLISTIAVLIGMSVTELVLYHYFVSFNLVILFMIISGFISASYLAVKGIREAKIWLIFTLPLIAAAIVFVLNDLLDILGLKVDAIFLMQAGALFSSFILCYVMYERVSHTVRRNLQMALENEHLVREQNVMLEQKVEERTYELRLEKEKSDELLLNILPFSIAEELKSKGSAQARHHDEVTVMFADIKNFTHTAEMLSPQELVEQIDFYFRAFDSIIEQHKLEKIKTIGDAYLCVGGLNGDGNSAAREVVLGALQMQEFVHKLKLKRRTGSLPFFEIRVGIHTGPIVAGVVGVKKFAYDIWGDTVNVAARMEQNSETGKVNISSTTYELVGGLFNCQERGKIAVKNKGEVEMYFVQNVKEVITS